jgi:hypothetical protein
MSDSIRIGIAGYGNLGRGVEASIALNSDMALVGIFTRRAPAQLTPLHAGTPVFAMDALADYTEKIDVLILCGGSKEDLPQQGPELAALFNTVDSSGRTPLRTLSTASGTGSVYCTPPATPGMRRIASEWPWLKPLPQKV